MSTCAQCQKFEPDDVNPAAGLGDCRETVERWNREGQWVPVLKYPFQRACDKFQ